MPKIALIVGVTGQAGAYLARQLVQRGYVVHGTTRQVQPEAIWRLALLGVEDAVTLHVMDIAEFSNILRVLSKVRPNEIYNLSGQSSVGLSFELPLYTADVNATGVGRLLEAIRTVTPESRFLHASSSEMFGRGAPPFDEETPLKPVSPYGAAKAFAHLATITYREAFGLHASNAVMFNHESILRGRAFVTRKIARGFAQIARGEIEAIQLGDLSIIRDWGHADEFMEGCIRIQTAPTPGDYVLATGRPISLQRFVELAAAAVDITLEWRRDGDRDVGVDQRTGAVRVQFNPAQRRPAEIQESWGDPGRIHTALGWSAERRADDIVAEMVDFDRRELDQAAR